MVSDPLFMGILAALVVSLPEIWPRIFAPLRFALPLSIALLGLGFILKSDSPFRVFTRLLPSSDRWTVRAFAGRYAWSVGITKFEGRMVLAGWLSCGREQRNKGVILFIPLCRMFGLTRIESSDLRNAGFSRIFAARLVRIPVS